MSTDVMTRSDCWAAAFERLDDSGPVHAIRREGYERFRDLGFPGPRDEDWRYTDLRPVSGGTFDVAPEAEIDPAVLEPYRVGLEGAIELVFVNGRFSPSHSRLAALPEGVRVAPLAELIARDFAAVEPYLAGFAATDRNPFTALNTALIEDGLAVLLPPNTALEPPVHVLYVNAPGTRSKMCHLRNLIVAGPGSEATVVESYAGPDAGATLTTAVTEIAAGANATLDHYKVQRESEEAYHVGSLYVSQDRDSNVTSHNFTIGGAIIRNDLHAALNATGCHSTFNGLSLTRGRQHVDNHLWIDHLQPHCNSWEFYKSILDDQSSSVFSGRIYVAQDAQKTDAKQTSMNLLLTDEAHADTKPQLEIFADDVKCTHGATIGQLDEDQLFYLRARGIGRDAARSLLIYAFANEVIDEVRLEPLRTRLEALLLQRLPRGDLLRHRA